MVHCPSCGKEVTKPSRELTNYSFTIQAYNCKKCRNHFKVVVNKSMYLEPEAGLIESSIV